MSSLSFFSFVQVKIIHEALSASYQDGQSARRILGMLIENVLIFQKEAFNIQLAVSQSSSAAWHTDPLAKTSKIKE